MLITDSSGFRPLSSLRHVAIVVRHHVITIANVGLRLTKTAATALNGALGTTLFAENLFFGTARSKLVVG